MVSLRMHSNHGVGSDHCCSIASSIVLPFSRKRRKLCAHQPTVLGDVLGSYFALFHLWDVGSRPFLSPPIKERAHGKHIFTTWKAEIISEEVTGWQLQGLKSGKTKSALTTHSLKASAPGV